MAVKIIILIALMAGTAFAYDPVSSYSVTNNRELLNPEVSFTGQVGRLMRVTTYVKNGDATPYDLGTNSVRAWITQADSGTNQTVTATIVSAANGIVQYQWSPTLDGNNSAKLVAYAMANTVTVAQIAEHYVTVTPGAANIVSLSLNPLIDLSGTVGTPTYRWASGAFGDLSVGSLSVTGAISAVDTGAVKLVGSDMTGGLTNRTAAGFVGNGANLTNLPTPSGVATDIVQGTVGGILVSNTAGRFYISATNASGGAAGDVYTASNNTFGVDTTQTLAETQFSLTNFSIRPKGHTNVVSGGKGNVLLYAGTNIAWQSYRLGSGNFVWDGAWEATGPNDASVPVVDMNSSGVRGNIVLDPDGNLTFSSSAKNNFAVHSASVVFSGAANNTFINSSLSTTASGAGAGGGTVLSHADNGGTTTISGYTYPVGAFAVGRFDLAPFGWSALMGTRDVGITGGVSRQSVIVASQNAYMAGGTNAAIVAGFGARQNGANGFVTGVNATNLGDRAWVFGGNQPIQNTNDSTVVFAVTNGLVVPINASYARAPRDGYVALFAYTNSTLGKVELLCITASGVVSTNN